MPTKHPVPAQKSRAAANAEDAVETAPEPTKEELEAQAKATEARAKVGETRIVPDSAV